MGESRMKGAYDHITTRICKKGEQQYPGSWMLDEPMDWPGIYKEWSKIIAYCNRHHIIIGRHEELKND